MDAINQAESQPRRASIELSTTPTMEEAVSQKAKPVTLSWEDLAKAQRELHRRLDSALRPKVGLDHFDSGIPWVRPRKTSKTSDVDGRLPSQQPSQPAAQIEPPQMMTAHGHSHPVRQPECPPKSEWLTDAPTAKHKGSLNFTTSQRRLAREGVWKESSNPYESHVLAIPDGSGKETRLGAGQAAQVNDYSGENSNEHKHLPISNAGHISLEDLLNAARPNAGDHQVLDPILREPRVESPQVDAPYTRQTVSPPELKHLNKEAGERTKARTAKGYPCDWCGEISLTHKELAHHREHHCSPRRKRRTRAVEHKDASKPRAPSRLSRFIGTTRHKHDDEVGLRLGSVESILVPRSSITVPKISPSLASLYSSSKSVASRSMDIPAEYSDHSSLTSEVEYRRTLRLSAEQVLGKDRLQKQALRHRLSRALSESGIRSSLDNQDDYIVARRHSVSLPVRRLGDVAPGSSPIFETRRPRARGKTLMAESSEKVISPLAAMNDLKSVFKTQCIASCLEAMVLDQIKGNSCKPLQIVLAELLCVLRIDLATALPVLKNDAQFIVQSHADDMHLAVQIIQWNLPHEDNEDYFQREKVWNPVEPLATADSSAILKFYGMRNDIPGREGFNKFQSQLVALAQIRYATDIVDLLDPTLDLEVHDRKVSKTSNELLNDLTWAPTDTIRIISEVKLSMIDLVKGWIEDLMGEEWDWWPLSPRAHALAAGFRRLHWMTPGGHNAYLDFSPSREQDLRDTLSMAPLFLNTGALNQGTGTIVQSGSSLAPGQSFAPVQGSSSSSITPPAQPLVPGSVSATPGPALNPSSPNTVRITAQRVYLCVGKGESYHFPSIAVHPSSLDAEFFIALKQQYLKTRRLLRNLFSMWRYSHCDFYEFGKHAFGTGEPTRMNFPADTNTDYDFDPRPIQPSPPLGPILKHEFRQFFHNPRQNSRYQSSTWRIWQRDRLLGNLVERKAIDLLPKKKSELHFDDGKRMTFWGLYAIERRAFAWLVAYACICNLPGIMFFFLWLFSWGHWADLQNAAVPVQLSLSLTVCFVALVYEGREGKKHY